MAKTLFEQNGGTYTKRGDYFLPDIKLPEAAGIRDRRMGSAPQTVS